MPHPFLALGMKLGALGGFASRGVHFGAHMPYHHAYGPGGGWLGHMIVSAVVHSIVWHMMFSLFRALGLTGSIVFGAIVLIGLFAWSRRPSARYY